MTLGKQQDVKIGISYKNRINGGNSIRDLGIVGDKNCN